MITQKRHKNFTQRLRTDIKRSVGVTTATQLVWLNCFTGSQPSNLPKKLWNQRDTNFWKIVNPPPYKDRGQIANQSKGAIKIITQTSIKGHYSLSKIYKDIFQNRLCSAGLEANSCPWTDRVPTDNLRGRGSGPCLNWGRWDKSRHIVPTT